MWRYIKAAFLVRVDVPTLGHVPLNALAVAGIGILGVANPAFWLLGAAAEAALVSSLAFNRRFQKIVDAQQLQIGNGDVERKRAALVSTLPPMSRERLSQLSGKCDKVLDVYRNSENGEFVLDANSDALRKLQWLYLKLLIADYNLRSHSTTDDERSLEQKIESLQKDLSDSEDSESLRQSKSSTLSILKKRLALWRRREQSLDEIASDLTRIEAQVDLLLENATMQGKPQAVSTEIELASDLVGGALFGDSENTIADLDHTYQQSKTTKPATAQEQ